MVVVCSKLYIGCIKRFAMIIRSFPHLWLGLPLLDGGLHGKTWLVQIISITSICGSFVYSIPTQSEEVRRREIKYMTGALHIPSWPTSCSRDQRISAERKIQSFCLHLAWHSIWDPRVVPRLRAYIGSKQKEGGG